MMIFMFSSSFELLQCTQRPEVSWLGAESVEPCDSALNLDAVGAAVSNMARMSHLLFALS